MTLWARLTWQVADPTASAVELGHRLGVGIRPGGSVPTAHLVALGSAELEVRPWVREGPHDVPRRAGRLMLEPVLDGEEPPVADEMASLELVGLGWATVDLDRAEVDLGPWLGERVGEGATDEHLGASVRLRSGGGLPGSWIVLLEPSTEGSVAASLARDGEGPCALYLWPSIGLDAWLTAAREERGVTTGRRGGGPFGDSIRLSGSSAGPFVIIVERPIPLPALPGAGTISA